MKFRTEIEIKERHPGAITHEDTVWTIGSCFADEVGDRMLAEGFNVEVNPLGTLYNPLSILRSVRNLVEGKHYEPSEFFEHEGKFRNFDFHSAFAKRSAEASAEFVNATLHRLHTQLPDLSVLMLTLGSSRAFYLTGEQQKLFLTGEQQTKILIGEQEAKILTGEQERQESSEFPVPPVLPSKKFSTVLLSETNRVVANCHKQNPKIFTQADITVETCSAAITETLRLIQGAAPRLRTIILTVSPIRHKAYGLHADRLSKARLLLAIDQSLNNLSSPPCTPPSTPPSTPPCTPPSEEQSSYSLCSQCPERQLRENPLSLYFPSYEIMMDDLRDYRFYCADMVHPSPVAVDYIYEHFSQTFFTPQTQQEAASRLRAFRRTLHRT